MGEETLAKTVKSFRKSMKKTQREFAEHSSLSRSTLIRVEKGEEPSEGTYVLLSKATGLPVQALKDLSVGKKRWIITREVCFSCKNKNGLYCFRDIVFGEGMNAFFRLRKEGKRKATLESNGAIAFRGKITKVIMSVDKYSLLSRGKAKAKIWEETK